MSAGELILDPFVTGKPVIFTCLWTDQSYAHRYLDGNTYNCGVWMAPSTDSQIYSGTRWRPIPLEGRNEYAFECLGAHRNPSCVYLDGNTYTGRVALAPSTDIENYSGTHWRVVFLSTPGQVGVFGLECLGTHKNPNWVYLKGYPDGGVGLVPAIGDRQSGTRWAVSLCRPEYLPDSIKKVIKKHYPNLPDSSISFYVLDGRLYYPLDLTKLWNIWRDSGVGTTRFDAQAYDSADYAMALKAEVAKWSYQNAESRYAYLCGIMYGRKGSTRYAFNFTLGHDRKLVLFDPRNGEPISPETWDVYFCLF